MDYEPLVKRFFIDLGYHVEKIPETDEKTPDFLIFDDTSSFLLELKTKLPSEAENEERRKLLDAGKIHSIHEEIVRKNRLSGIITKAKNQLESYKEKDVLRIIWLLTTGHRAELRKLQFESTLYGLDCVGDVTNDRILDCYFFHNSDFFRYREILDGAIVATESEAILFLNPLSPRYVQIKSSSLPKHLGGYVVDPIEREKNGEAFFIDSDVNRGDEESVLRYLRDKYKSDNMVKLATTYLSETKSIPRTTE